ncbi:MAG: hypothetical protein RIC38_01915 [Chromatocurvus sp.]
MEGLHDSRGEDTAGYKRGNLERVGTTDQGYPDYESVRVGYAYTEAEDVNPMTSSVAFSNHANRAFFDPQADELSPSNWAIEHRFTTVLNYAVDFFGGYEMNQPSFPYGVTAQQQANGQARQRIGEASLWSMRVGVNYRF